MGSQHRAATAVVAAILFGRSDWSNFFGRQKLTSQSSLRRGSAVWRVRGQQWRREAQLIGQLGFWEWQLRRLREWSWVRHRRCYESARHPWHPWCAGHGRSLPAGVYLHARHPRPVCDLDPRPGADGCVHCVHCVRWNGHLSCQDGADSVWRR